MRIIKTPNQQRRRIIEFIKKNPKATHREIRKKTKLHPERFFKSLAEAFKEAKVRNPRTFERKNKLENRKIILEYIKKNPKAGGHTISKAVKRNPSKFFKSIKDAYKQAGVKYPREKSYNNSPKEKREIIIKLIKKDPYLTLTKLTEKSKTFPLRLFGNLDEIYKKAGVKRINQGEKIKERKRVDVIKFIKQKTLATQREINKNCNTHVQTIFKNGIFEAYEKAGVKFPFKRLKLYGTALKEIKKRAKDFEEEIAVKLSGYGRVNRLVKTKRGVADIILERKDKKIVIEVKDYQQKEISISQIKQLNNYIEDCEGNIGILICHKKPRKDKFLIGKNKICVLEKQELYKIPEII